MSVCIDSIRKNKVTLYDTSESTIESINKDKIITDSDNCKNSFSMTCKKSGDCDGTSDLVIVFVKATVNETVINANTALINNMIYSYVKKQLFMMSRPLVSNFWMPDKKWKGCNVSDPSEHVLSNYGTSGK